MMRFLSVALALSLFLAPLAAQKAQQKHVPDGEVIDQVRVHLANDPDVGGIKIDVDAHDGAVTLTGKVKTEKQRVKAEKLAKKVKGVSSVNNQLVVSPD
jgi:hyperosmotically inducible periplasmic protein